jgi:hypothetical protein
MTLDEFIDLIDNTLPPAPEDELAAFESRLGGRLPDDYRDFLVRTNGGVARDSYRFKGPVPVHGTWVAILNRVFGFREELHL